MVANRISQALEDNKISEEEFESLLGITNTFYDERQIIGETMEPNEEMTKKSSLGLCLGSKTSGVFT